MKKIAVMMVIGLVATSYGSIKVNWSAGAGFYWDPSFDALLGTGQSTIAQLMYSPDATKDNITTSLVGDVNDIIFATYTITEGVNASAYADFSPGLYSPGTFTAGYVYALIFQDNNVQVGDWYFYTPMLALEDITGATPAQSLQMNTDLINGDAINAGATVAQVIPEPTTALLFGIGAMGAWLVRRNKIKSKEEADA